MLVAVPSLLRRAPPLGASPKSSRSEGTRFVCTPQIGSRTPSARASALPPRPCSSPVQRRTAPQNSLVVSADRPIRRRPVANGGKRRTRGRARGGRALCLRPTHPRASQRQSAHGTTSPLVKALVSGLTAAVNILGSRGAVQRTEAADSRPPLAPTELLAGIEKDFTENGYLWSGEIDRNMYCLNCTFTDPTLSFQGLDVFESNIRNLKPWLDKLVRRPLCELQAIELDESCQEVRAQWRMAGDITLPWRPRVELTGRTTFRYDPKLGGRVVEYFEEWDIAASTALLQLVRPGRQ